MSAKRPHIEVTSEAYSDTKCPDHDPIWHMSTTSILTSHSPSGLRSCLDDQHHPERAGMTVSTGSGVKDRPKHSRAPESLKVPRSDHLSRERRRFLSVLGDRRLERARTSRDRSQGHSYKWLPRHNDIADPSRLFQYRQKFL